MRIAAMMLEAWTCQMQMVCWRSSKMANARNNKETVLYTHARDPQQSARQSEKYSGAAHYCDVCAL